MMNYENTEIYEPKEIMMELSKLLPDIEILRKMSAFLLQRKTEALRYGWKEDEERIQQLSLMVWKRLSEIQRMYPF